MTEKSGNKLPAPRFGDRIWKIFKSSGVVVGLIASIVTLYLWICAYKSTPEIKATIVDRQCMTRVGSMPISECKFFFKGRNVGNLWLVKMRLQNGCSRNIIGVAGGDLMYSNLVFRARGIERIAFADCEEDNVGGGSLSWRSNEVCYAFTKWKPEQFAIVRLYCEGYDEEYFSLCPSMDMLKQGECLMTEQRYDSPSLSLIARMPYLCGRIVTFLGLLVFGSVFILCLWWMLFGMHWVRTFRRLLWNRKYFNAATAMLKSESEEQNSSVVKSIDGMPKEYWLKHNIPQPPTRTSFVKGTKLNWEEIRPHIVIASILITVSTVALSALITY